MWTPVGRSDLEREQATYTLKFDNTARRFESEAHPWISRGAVGYLKFVGAAGWEPATESD